MRSGSWATWLVPSAGVRVSLGLLLLRLVAGYAMTLHGAPKLHAPFHWLDTSPQHRYLPGMPSVLQGVVAYNESFGGFLLMAGLLTPLIAVLLVGDLGTVVFAVNLPHGHPFVGRGSFEIPGLLLTIAVTLLLGGPGRFSLDALLWCPRSR